MADEVKVSVPGVASLPPATRASVVQHVERWARDLLAEASRVEASDRTGGGPAQITVTHVEIAAFSKTRGLGGGKKDLAGATLSAVAVVFGIAAGWFGNHTDEVYGVWGLVFSAVVAATAVVWGFKR
ncbi:hypothetical protein FB565_001539 [Actinoplanes lutulentus]|uniref:hypothetical protein n=1 Tax=Actinoplanes lutulentus TaxID=1287878 RepID=UPI0011B9474A|nr:hypothetical protein [Actinoplanes lutulentus]MBB2941835.1 hypothetical protein [Actinoplanes lutulentus]